MEKIEQTILWQKTFGRNIKKNVNDIERLRTEFIKMRSKSSLLAAEIDKVMPNLTVHNITHSDALWETSDIIINKDLIFTPAEVFVLGAVFLIHDLGMGLASFPKGIDGLKKETLWRDTYSSFLKREEELTNKEIERNATYHVLRMLHAKNAEKLATISWSGPNNEELFLIEDSYLRESYGRIIGLIANSHWWSVDELENNLPRPCGAPGEFNSDWTVDPVKLACIFRIADAIHLDDRRAPSFLYAIKNLNGNFKSEIYWNFQQKLYKPKIENNRLVYTSKSSFQIKDYDSWWLCYDELKKIDNELKEIDALLAVTNRTRLNIIGIASIEDPIRFSKLVTIDGWQPVDTKIKIANVVKLVEMLGGYQLYGYDDDKSIPLRELIQNASDAIRARRILENECPEFGSVKINFGEDAFGEFIEVEDNGIGMSSKVLTGPFLDFGESFWGSSLMHDEFPGLESKKFAATGKYGIGFFSVFMWGKKVSIFSKRYEKGRDSTLVLEFHNGTKSRPILRKAVGDEVIKDGGTKIKVWFSKPNIIQEGIWGYNITESDFIQKLCPSIDCNIILKTNSKEVKVIEANDWLRMAPLKLIKRIAGKHHYNNLDKNEKCLLSDIAKNMTLLKEKDGSIVGRLSLYSQKIESNKDKRLLSSISGIVTIGGMKSSHLSGLTGILIGKSNRASRDSGVPIISNTTMKQWLLEQIRLLSKINLSPESEIEIASIVRKFETDTLSLKIGYYKNTPVDYNDIKKFIINTNYDSYLIVKNLTIIDYEKKYSCKFDSFDNVFYVENTGIPGILHAEFNYHNYSWPKLCRTWFHNQTLYGLFIKAFAEVWKCDINEILKVSDISDGINNYTGLIGKAKGKNITSDYVDIIKKPKKLNN